MDRIADYKKKIQNRTNLPTIDKEIVGSPKSKNKFNDLLYSSQIYINA